MHEVLQSLGCGYDANNHWTSKLRTMAGYMPYDGADDAKATFTFPDKQGIFTKYLQECGFEAAMEWDPTATYHIDVKGTRGKLSAPFQVSPGEFDRVGAQICISRITLTYSRLAGTMPITLNEKPKTLQCWFGFMVKMKS
jgi:hypothetical protein